MVEWWGTEGFIWNRGRGRRKEGIGSYSKDIEGGRVANFRVTVTEVTMTEYLKFLLFGRCYEKKKLRFGPETEAMADTLSPSPSLSSDN